MRRASTSYTSEVRPASLLLLLTLAACGAEEMPQGPREDVVATFSIVARDAATGDLGVAVQSKFLGVGAVVPFARADVGAIATQAFANTTYGPRGLGLLDNGASAADVVAQLVEADDGRKRRQLGIVDARGRAKAYTGATTNAWAGHKIGDGYCCQGNILAGEAVVTAMARAFEETEAKFPERLVAALAAGQAAGGDRRGRQSAALLVVRRGGGYARWNDRYIDLHVEDHPKPIEELGRVLALHRGVFPDRPPRRPPGLVRESCKGPTARAAWLAEDEAHASRHYVGTRIVGDKATVLSWTPQAATLKTDRYVRTAGRWTAAP